LRAFNCLILGNPCCTAEISVVMNELETKPLKAGNWICSDIPFKASNNSSLLYLWKDNLFIPPHWSMNWPRGALKVPLRVRKAKQNKTHFLQILWVSLRLCSPQLELNQKNSNDLKTQVNEKFTQILHALKKLCTAQETSNVLNSPEMVPTHHTANILTYLVVKIKSH